MYPVTIIGRTVALRDFRAGDAASALQVVGDDQVTRWLSFDSRDLAGASRMIENAIEQAEREPRTEFYLAVTLPAGGEVSGFARLALDGVTAGKLGYAIRADRWGRGYATDAARTLADFGFGRLGLHRISAAIGPGQRGVDSGRGATGHEVRGPHSGPRLHQRGVALFALVLGP
jgi:ribosomal-protein-alanine N-acetyltransferase